MLASEETLLFSVRRAEKSSGKIRPIARIGEWGNVDSDARGPIGFTRLEAIAASDTALYVADALNTRILEAALGYHAGEELPLP